jgi:hypothetical protein
LTCICQLKSTRHSRLVPGYLKSDRRRVGVLDLEDLRHLHSEGPWARSDNGGLEGNSAQHTAEPKFDRVDIDGHDGGRGGLHEDRGFRLTFAGTLRCTTGTEGRRGAGRKTMTTITVRRQVLRWASVVAVLAGGVCVGQKTKSCGGWNLTVGRRVCGVCYDIPGTLTAKLARLARSRPLALFWRASQVRGPVLIVQRSLWGPPCCQCPPSAGPRSRQP